MPKSASYRPSPRSAISARASTTWLPTAQSKHSSPHRVPREKPPPWKGTRRSTTSRRRLPRPLNKRGIGAPLKPGKHRGQSNCCDGEAGRKILFHPELLLELPQVKKKKNLMKNFFFCCCFSFGVTLRNTAVLLHSGCCLNIRVTAVLWGAFEILVSNAIWRIISMSFLRFFLFMWYVASAVGIIPHFCFCIIVRVFSVRFCCLTVLSPSWLLHLIIRRGRDVTDGTSVMNVSLHSAWGTGGFVRALGYSYRQCVGTRQYCNWPSSFFWGHVNVRPEAVSSFWSVFLLLSFPYFLPAFYWLFKDAPSTHSVHIWSTVLEIWIGIRLNPFCTTVLTQDCH